MHIRRILYHLFNKKKFNNICMICIYSNVREYFREPIYVYLQQQIHPRWKSWSNSTEIVLFEKFCSSGWSRILRNRQESIEERSIQMPDQPRFSSFGVFSHSSLGSLRAKASARLARLYSYWNIGCAKRERLHSRTIHDARRARSFLLFDAWRTNLKVSRSMETIVVQIR